jgi:hypothetical protein
VELEYLRHKATRSPIETIAALIAALKELKAPSLQSQASHLREMLVQMIQQGEDYMAMIDAVSGDGVAKPAAPKSEEKAVTRPR